MVVNERNGMAADIGRSSFFDRYQEDGHAGNKAGQSGFEILGIGKFEQQKSTGFENPGDFGKNRLKMREMMNHANKGNQIQTLVREGSTLGSPGKESDFPVTVQVIQCFGSEFPGGFDEVGVTAVSGNNFSQAAISPADIGSPGKGPMTKQAGDGNNFAPVFILTMLPIILI